MGMAASARNGITRPEAVCIDRRGRLRPPTSGGGRCLTQRTVSRAISSSSLVGITKVRTRAPSALTSPSLPRTAASFFAASTAMPRKSMPWQIRARISAEFSPMPPVKTIGVGAVHLREVRADVVLHPQAEDVDREPRPAVLVDALLLEQLAHVVGQARDAEEARTAC